MGMFAAKKYFYLMGVFCFLVASSSLHLWADEGSPGKVSSEQQKAEGRQEKAPAQNQPRISIDAISFDAGEVWEGDTVSHTFTVKNTGTAELEIKKVKTG
jgi:hypothetical protein